MRDIEFELVFPACIDFDVVAPDELEMDISSSPVVHYDAPPYEGEYEVTPTEETQILETDGKTMTADVVVNSIPQDYGRIVYDGVILRIL